MRIAGSHLWGVGCYLAGDALVTYPVSADDVARDTGSALAAMRTLGVKPGGRVLVLSRMAETAQYFPVVAGALAAGAQVSCAEATRFDAYRTALFLRRLRYEAVVGVDADLLDGLEEAGAPAPDLLADVPVVAARAGARERLSAAGLRPRRWLHLGPALAVECDRAAGAHVDGDEWTVEEAGGEILLTARRPRAATIDRVGTGVAGTVIREACGCGRPDPRILPDDEKGDRS